MKRALFFPIIALLLISSAYAVVENHGIYSWSNGADTFWNGMKITPKANNYLRIDSCTVAAGNTAPYMIITNASTNKVLARVSISSGTGTLNFVTGDSSVIIFAGNDGATYTQAYSATGVGYPISGTLITWDGDYSGGTGSCTVGATCTASYYGDTRARGIQSCTVSNVSAVPATAPVLTIQVNDTRAGQLLSGFTYAISSTNTTTPSITAYCATSSCSTNYTFSSGNISITNITGEYYNGTVSNYRFNTTETLTIGTYRSFLNITVIDAVSGTVIPRLCVSITNGTTSYISDGTTYCSATGSYKTPNIEGIISLTVHNLNDGSTFTIPYDQHYANQTYTNGSFNATLQLSLTSYTGLGTVMVTQLYTNATILSYNVSNGRYTNNTPDAFGRATIALTKGQNNLTANITGNYSATGKIGAAYLTNYNTTIDGVHDNKYTLGVKYAGTPVNSFNISVTNDALAINNTLHSTTTGSVTIPLLQGYPYLFKANTSIHTVENVTLQANASQQYYNFSVYTTNTFDLNFRNETTNTPLTGSNITIQLISDAFASNYTTSNGSLVVSLLTPGAYTIRYWTDPNIPRDYYVTLNQQSYNNITLYVIDSGVSSVYLPIIKDQNTAPVGSATVQLLRYYINPALNSGSYTVVEMSQTDTNGQAVLRVVPNVINYKLVVSKSGTSITTAPTKFTSTTNTYTINFQQNPLTSIQGMGSVQKSLTFNNATSTYAFTWTDTTNLVTGGCLYVTKTRLGRQTNEFSQCTTGATGSIIYTVTDTNQTTYSAQATLSTNTAFSTYTFGPVSIDFSKRHNAFGLVGVLVTLIVFLTLAFIGTEMGTKGTVVAGVLAIMVMSIFGFIAYRWEALIGIVIVAGIIIYKARQ